MFAKIFIMINNWFSPVDTKQLKDFTKLKSHQFGKKIILHKDASLDLSNTHIAIVGVGKKEADAIREILYSSSFPFKKLNVVDLGNARKEEGTFLTPILKELLDSNIFPIILGKMDEYAFAQYHAYQFKKELINMVVVDEKIKYNNPRSKYQTYLNKIIDSRTSHLFNLSMLGYQSHFTPTENIKVLEKNNFEGIRLGQLRNNIEYAEPIVRDADMMCFNLNAIRYSECPGVLSPSPSGFFSEEACQIARYAGMSEKLSSVGFYGYQADLDINQQSAHVAAQLTWYCIDGFCNRKNDYPKSIGSLTEYIVDTKKIEYSLTFWKSEKTGRWWMQIPIKTKKKLQRHQLVPCSYQDYQMACREELPERLINAFNRFS